MNTEDILSMFSKDELNCILGDCIAKKYYFYKGFDEECISLKEEFGHSNKSTFKYLDENETRNFARKKFFELRDALEHSNDTKQLFEELAIDVNDNYFNNYNSSYLKYGCYIYALFEEKIALYLTKYLLNNNLSSEQIINYIVENSNNNLVCVSDTWCIEDSYECHEINENQNINYYILDLSIFMDELNNLGASSYLDRYSNNKSSVSYRNILISNFDDEYYSFLTVMDNNLQNDDENLKKYKKKVK